MEYFNQSGKGIPIARLDKDCNTVIKDLAKGKEKEKSSKKDKKKDKGDDDKKDKKEKEEQEKKKGPSKKRDR